MDMFEIIILFDNWVQEFIYWKLDNGKYEVNFMAYVIKFWVDFLGIEMEILICDYIDVVVFVEFEDDEECGRVLYQECLLIQ